MVHTVVGTTDRGVPGAGVEGEDATGCCRRGPPRNSAFELADIARGLLQNQWV